MSKQKAETFFLVTAKGEIKDYGDDILEAVSALKKTPKGAVIRSDGVIMAGEPRTTQTVEEFQPVPWGKTRKVKYTDEEEAPKKKTSSRPPKGPQTLQN